LGTLWGRDGVARKTIESSLKSTVELVNPSEGVSFTAHVYKDGLIARRKIKPDQLKFSGCRIQHRIESPGSGILIGLQFPDEVSKQSVSVLAGYAVSGSKGSVETFWITSVPHRDGLCSLRVNEAGRKQCHANSRCEPSHISSKLSCLWEYDLGLAAPEADARPQSDSLVGTVKRKGAELPPLLYFAVEYHALLRP
jgi:hypothetical protein